MRKHDIKKLVLKRELEKIGVTVVKGNFVKKSQIKKALVRAYIPGTGGVKVKLSCTFDEIKNKFAHSTMSPDTFYIDYEKLPKCIQDEFEKVEPYVDDSKYTVYEPIAYLRLIVETKDGAKLNMEVHLGECSGEERQEEEDEENEDKEDEDLQYVADEMKATFDWRLQDVYFEVLEYPEEGED